MREKGDAAGAGLPVASDSVPEKNCTTNHSTRNSGAGNSAIVKKIPRKTNVFTRDHGNHTRYAPITPAIAPEAPTIGTGESGATTPAPRRRRAPHSR